MFPNTINKGFEKKSKRLRKNKPAVTSVDLWTRALTGVGASIAKGSQTEKGNCADFVRAPIIRNNER